ncbi:hypothetical protein [Nonomuraea sp. NPDC049400]
MNKPYCRRCLGSGAITAYRSQLNPTGQTLVIEVAETCSTHQGGRTR